MIRPATVADAAAIAACHVAGWQVGCAGILPADYLDGLTVTDADRRWLSALARPDHQVLVATDATGAVVGFARTGMSPDPLPGDDPVPGELRELYVSPDHWGTAVATELHRAAVQDLATAGYSVVVLWVVQGNDRAIRFYRRCGWRRDKWERTVPAGGHTWTELRFTGNLQLPSP